MEMHEILEQLNNLFNEELMQQHDKMVLVLSKDRLMLVPPICATGCEHVFRVVRDKELKKGFTSEEWYAVIKQVYNYFHEGEERCRTLKLFQD